MVAVIGSNGTTVYQVTKTSCTCPDYLYRQRKIGGMCKHIIKCFYPHMMDDITRREDAKILEAFNEGLDIDKAYETYGDEKIDVWLKTGEICKSHHTGKTLFWRL